MIRRRRGSPRLGHGSAVWLGLEAFDAESLEKPPVDGVLVNSNSARLREASVAPSDITYEPRWSIDR